MPRYVLIVLALAMNIPSAVTAEEADLALYLAARSAFDGKQYAEVVQRCQQLIQQYPDSEWRNKAVFLQADAHAQARQFDEAATIYEQEAKRLLSTDRKSDIAQIYTRFAALVSRKPGKNELDAPPPDYGKAHRLYELALNLEIPNDLRDEVMFRMARMRQLAQEWGPAVQEYERYLRVFDPESREHAATHDKSESAGSHLFQAHLHLAECQLADGRTVDARITAEDLITRLGTQEALDAPLEDVLRDIRFLLVQTYGLNRDVSEHDFSRAVRAAREFTAAYPTDPRHVALNYQIGRVYEERGRSEEALKTYRDFAQGDGIQLSDQRTADGEPVRDVYDRLRMRATYHIGHLLFQQRRFAEAIEAWSGYVSSFPNGPQWTDAQQQIISAEFEIGLEHLRQEQFDEAKASWDRFLTEHPLDPRCRQILFTYGAIHARDAEAEPEELRQAIAIWDQLVQKYPETDESSYALFRIGQVYEEQLGDMEKALEAYRKLTWGSWEDDARQRIAQMTQKHLGVVTERIFRTNETPVLNVSMRNIKALTVNVYAIDLEAYWRKRHEITGIDQLDIGLIDPDKTWVFEVPEYAKYRPHEHKIEIPMDGAGIVAVHVGEEDMEATTLVIRSDLELILKSSRREALVFVQDMLQGQPASGARVLLSAKGQLVAEGETNADGIFHKQIPELKESQKLSAFVLHQDNVASNLADLQGLGLSTGLNPRGYLYTGRPAYRPGQTVSIRGILRNVHQGSYAVPQDTYYRLSVVDAQGRAIHEEDLPLSEFGTLNTRLDLDSEAAVGEYRILVRDAGEQGPTFTGVFEVQRFQLEKLSLKADFAHPVYFRGETVEATFTAAYYYGQPLVDRPIRVHLPDGRNVTKPTDATGKISVEFDTTHFQPGTVLTFYAVIEGEGVSTSGQVFLAALGYSVQVLPQAETVLAGEPVDVLVKTVGADGKPAGRELTLTVLRQTRTKPSTLLQQIRWFRHAAEQQSAEVEVETHTLQTDTTTGEARQTLTLAEGGTHILRVQGQDRFGQTVMSEGRFQVSDDADAVRLRIFADSSHLQVGDRGAVRIHSRLEPSLSLVTFEGEGILSYRVMQLADGYNDLVFDVGHEHFPNFHLGVTVVDTHHESASKTPILRIAGKDFTVERQLRLALNASKEIYAPGEQAEFELLATDQQGKPVRAEISLALVDEALYALFTERMPPIRQFFEEGLHRDAAMRTVSSCTFRYAPSTRGTIKEWLEEEKREHYARRLREQASEIEVAAIAALPLAEREAIIADDGLGGMVDNITLGTELARKPVSRARSSFSKRAAGRYYAGFAADAGVADDKLASLAPSQQPIRQELLDAGLWLPAVVTDAEGKATVTFEMPQKTTQWRITGRGCTVETLVGDSEDKLITRKAFFVDLKLPGIFTEGDQLRPMVQVHNLADFEGDVEVQLAWHAEDSEQDQKTATKTVSVSSNGTAEVLFEALTIPAGSMIHFEVSAEADDGKLQDALHKSVPIHPWGIELSDTRSRVATGDETIFLELPALPNLTNQRLTIQIAPQVERLILDLALGHYPIILREGTTRAPTTSHSRSPVIRPPSDTGSELLAVTAALRYLRGVPGTTKDTAALMRRGRTLVNSLVVRQREDGGWSWSPGSKEADPHVSARALWGLAAAKANGIAVPDAPFEKAAAHLQSVFSQTDDDETRAVVIHSLTRAGQGDFSVANRLYRNRQRLNPRAIAATALTFVLLDRNEIASELVELALQKTELEPMPTDVLALNLLTLQATQPQSPQVTKLVDALMARRRWGGFHPHEAKGAATTALADQYRQTQFASNDYRLTILVNNAVLREATINQGQSVIDIETDTLVEGANRVEFRVEGQARYAYRATLTGFLTDIPEKLEKDSSLAKLVQKGKVRRHYYHAPLEYRGRPITQSTSEITQLPYGNRTAVSVSLNELPFDVPMVVIESLPAGTTLIPDSVKGNFQYHEVGDGEIRFFLDRYWGISVQRNRSRLPRLSIRYELMSYAPGTYRVLPTRVYYAESPDRRILGQSGKLTVLARGETSSDVYVMNNGERYELGKAHFDDGNYAEALPLLQELRERDADYHEREVARMLLWISTEADYFDAPRVVDTFEILRERFPELTIPFDKILVVGKAYREMNETERGYLVFRSTLNASYANDSHVSAVLQDEGQFLNSVEAQRALWLQYPDTAEVVSSYFALSQALYAQSPQARELAKVKVLPVLEDGGEPKIHEDLTSAILLRDTIQMLARFLSLYSRDPLADDATFSLANAYLDLERYPQAVELCGLAQQRYLESEFLSSFQYVQALGLFSQHKFQEAIQAAETVAEGKSKDRDLARYILGQVHHAQGSPDEAIRWYRLVREVYPDAAESISAFEARRISLEEVTRVRPGEPVSLELKYRNIREAALQVYRVDLMKLYLREKNLSEITQVRLEGISPQQSTLIPLGDGKDYADKEKSVTLDLADEGAYLVICRGDDLFTSGLVLITPMEMETQEDTVSGRVRVNLTKGVAGEHPEGIHVKVVGSADQRFISGETDLRGIFVADGVRGVATVLARDEQNRYAFHRGTQWIGASADDDRSGGVERGEAAGVQQQEVDFRQNLLFQNKALQGANVERFEELRRGQKRGVEVQKAY